METKKIEVGDIVEAWWTEADKGSEAKVIHLPCGAGDTIQVEHLATGMVELINPYCYQFIGLTRKESTND